MERSYVVTGHQADGTRYFRRFAKLANALREADAMRRGGAVIVVKEQWLDGRYDDRLIWRDWETAAGGEESAVSVL